MSAADPFAWTLPPVADVDMAAADASPAEAVAASIRLASSSIGKSLGTGGGGKLVQLVVVGRDTRCLGFIGSGKSKICLGPRTCDTKSHEKDRFSFPEGVTDLVFINVGSPTQAAAWATPFVEFSWL